MKENPGAEERHGEKGVVAQNGMEGRNCQQKSGKLQLMDALIQVKMNRQ